MQPTRLANIGMQIQNYYNSEAFKSRSSFSQGTISETNRNSFLIPKSKAEIKLLAAKKHSEAEKRRRMRINGQYATLRTILPNLVKVDKASVLAETIRQVKELKKNVSELEAISANSSGEITVFPSEVDKLKLEHCKDEEGLMKATLSCEDRPGLMSAMTRALKSLRAKVVKAEMVNVGGRIREVLWVQGLENGNEGMGVLKRTLKVVMHKPTLKMHRLTRTG
ncbi:transcription factor bHLH131 isoform X2 [Prosopis cineraria]|uniref:transcription factor bHLH131 isoform X2 n=1 Tax=Prosopis cineraria TaxID=364024 RepID=UPI00240F22C0|nr:transcription factor bHLH131 isoform X2 [Prosopis cineraria]